MTNTVRAVLLCLVACCALLACVEGRSHGLARKPEPRSQEDLEGSDELSEVEELVLIRHPRHRRPDPQVESDDSDDYDEDVAVEVKEPVRRHSRRHHQVPKFEEELKLEVVEKPVYSHHRRHHHKRHARHHQREELDIEEADEVRELVARGKRHNEIDNWNLSSTTTNSADSNPSDEMDIHDVQNRAVCNYTIEPVPSEEGRIPNRLEHIKCNYAGSECRKNGHFCCIQTYKEIDLYYKNGTMELFKLYTGCVCAGEVYSQLDNSSERFKK